MKTRAAIVVLISAFVSLAFAQTTSSIHLFQNYLWDADVSDTPYDEVFLDLTSYDFGSTTHFGLKGGFSLTPNWEMNGQLSFATRSIEHESSTSGLSDLMISGRYLPIQKAGTHLGIGAQLILPLGDEDVGYGKGGFGMFGALRRHVSEKSIVTACIGVDIVPEYAGADENIAALKIGGGWIRRLDQRTCIITEAVVISSVDYMVFSGGIDHLLANGCHFRAVLGLGADVGSPKVFISSAYTFSF